ncbi:hypothetical protein [Streptomyces viridochromogenes]
MIAACLGSGARDADAVPGRSATAADYVSASDDTVTDRIATVSTATLILSSSSPPPPPD